MQFCFMASELKPSQKKSWAYLLYEQGNMSQKEIALKVGVSENTITKWKDENNWEAMRKSTLTSKSEILKGFYDTLDKIRKKLKDDDDFGDTKLADMAVKYTAAIRNLETEASIGDLMEAGRLFINFLLSKDAVLAQRVLNEYDVFIKDRLRTF